MRKTTPSTLVLCLALTGLAGCTTDPDPVATTPKAVESGYPEDEAEAVQEAEQAIRDWMRVSYQCLADPPNTDLSCFDEVAYGDQLATERSALELAQAEGVRYVGEPTYVRTERVDYVDLSIGPDKEIRLSVCWSIENLDAVRSDGTSVIPPDEPRRTRDIFVVLRHTDEWQVAEIQDDPEGAVC